ncbi:hypothetical protein [Caldivirga sp. UBA161]|uniref:hypothetical protein n=1 Tax=Caldivirga sp. UBA161 TaxID=1915569 RepID=UPI0025BBF8AD|nr:hypothetical protein [Caldivirga sp. UBA161]
MALVINLGSDWWISLYEFTRILHSELGDSLLMVIGSQDGEPILNDTNTLVIVRSINDNIKLSVAKAALEVNDKFKSVISYMVITEGDKETINKFIHTPIEDWSDYESALSEFKQLLTESLGNRLISMIALPKGIFINESNVLIIVNKIDDDVRLKVAKAALEVNDRFKSTVSYMIVEEGDSDVILKFREV